MSSTVASIVPPAPLTDETFPFNRDAFIQIHNYQEKDIGFLDSPPVQTLVGVGDVVGGSSTAVVGAVGQGASGVTSALLGGVGKVTSGLPGEGLLHQAGQGILRGISTTDVVAQQLVDPTKVAREHYHYSNDVKKALPPAIDAVDEVIHKFAFGAGHVVQELYENIPAKGILIITELINQLGEVDKALTALYSVLTKNNIQESLKVGEILKTIEEVKAAFADIAANFKAAESSIKSGISDPNQIFAQSQEEVAAAWQNLEVKRKTMTYLPYKY